MSKFESNGEVAKILTEISQSVTAEEISRVKEVSRRVGDAYASCNRGLVVYHEDSCTKDEY